MEVLTIMSIDKVQGSGFWGKVGYVVTVVSAAMSFSPVVLAENLRVIQKIKYKDGISYIGETEGMDRDGNGTLFDPDGFKIYEGEFSKNKRDGFGISSYKEGDRYEGNWEADMRHGYGEQTSLAGYRYDGHWKYDKRDGEGTLIDPDGTTEFQGKWKIDKPDGPGRKGLSDGSIVEVYWKDGQMFSKLNLELGSKAPEVSRKPKRRPKHRRIRKDVI